MRKCDFVKSLLDQCVPAASEDKMMMGDLGSCS